MINIRNQPAPDQCQCYVKSGWSASVTRRWCGGVMDYLLQSQGELSPFLPFVNITSDQPGESGGRDNRFSQSRRRPLLGPSLG